MKKFITIILIAALVGITAYISWSYYDQKQSNTIDSKSHVEQQETENNPPEKAKHLVIKEWDVKLPLDVGAEDATYTLSDSGTFITLSTTKLYELAQENPGCSEIHDSVVISRAQPGDERFGSPWTEEDLEKVSKKVGSYYYLQEAKKPYCNNESSVPKDKLDQMLNIRGKLSISVENIQPVE